VLIERIEDIFLALGWSRAEGPEVEDEFHNFNALNIPPHHPARDDHDTFWLSHPSALLRTHTSSVEIRYLQREVLPCAIFAPGRVFRHEATDATHDFAFMQCEGLLVDKHVSLAHLRAILTLFMQQLFDNNKLALRVRPSYFPFVEPGLEVDVTCPFCTSGCSICKRTGWIELGGAGLTHPAVLKACDIDPQQWTGCAFGFGIERLGQLFYRIPDVRLFKTGKIRFLEQIASIPTH
jgi:phenylalanyl-tRNA synthetase alpha chain